MKHKGFVAIAVCLIAVATVISVIGVEDAMGFEMGQTALAAPGRALPEITSVEPDRALNDVNTTISISGSNFEEAAIVYLGETKLEDVTWEDEHTLTVVIPSGWDAGVYDLKVENTPEEVAVLDGAFEVIDVWTAGTIEGGRIDEIVINPQDPNTLYASAYGIGLYRSRDAGESWQFILADGYAEAVSISPVEPNHLYLFAPWQLFHSADEGDNWAPLETQFPVPFNPSAEVPGWRCASSGLSPYAHPEIKGTVFVSVSNHGHFGSGLIKSKNYGLDWLPVIDGLLDDPIDPFINDLAFHPDDPEIIVVGTGLGNLFISNNRGESWEFLSRPIDMAYICKIEFNPFDPDELWIGGDKLAKSINGSYTAWEEVDLPPDHPYGPEETRIFDRFFISPHEEPGWVYWHLIGSLYRSNDRGDTWEIITWNELSHSSIIVESPGNADVVYLGDRFFGIYKSVDGGVTWETKNQGLTATVPEYLRVSPADPSLVYGSVHHTSGIFRGLKYATSWDFLLHADIHIQTMEADPFVPERVFAAGFDTIYRSDDGGETWIATVELDLPEEHKDCVSLFLVLRAHPKLKDTLLAGLMHLCDRDNWDYSDGSIYYSNDGGQSWVLADTPGGMQVVWDLAFDILDGTIAYAGTTDGFYRSEDTGKTWVRMEGEPGYVYPGRVHSIAVEPDRNSGKEPHIVVMDGSIGAIMVSSNQGEDWDVLFYPSPNDNFEQLIFTPTDPQTLYAASRTGLRYSPDYGETWFRVPGDLGYVLIRALATVKEEDRAILYVATPGGYAARTDTDVMSPVSVGGLRESTTLVHPGVYRYTQTAVYTILATAGDNGSIKPSGEVTVDGGEDQSFTITAENGYQIADVKVDGVSVYPDDVEGGVYTFNEVQENHTIYASFEAIPEQVERYFIPLILN